MRPARPPSSTTRWGDGQLGSRCTECAATRPTVPAPPSAKRSRRSGDRNKADGRWLMVDRQSHAAVAGPSTTNDQPSTNEAPMEKSTWRTKVGLAEMLKGGVIMDVTNAEQALIAAEAGAVAVMALERVPSDIRAQGGVARMTDPKIIRDIMDTLKAREYDIPVMAKARIGHFVEAQVLEALGVDFIDESEVLTPADEEFHINKHLFRAPFVCGCRDLGEALRRIGEGAAMIR